MNCTLYKEEFVEEGIVADVKDGIATILIFEEGSCEECGAKIFCKPGEDKKTLTAKDPFGVKAGDKVRVAIRGRNVLAASAVLYGIPLLLILGGIFFGMNFFNDDKEIYSSLLGISLLIIYYAAIYFISKTTHESSAFIPEIIFVTSRTPLN